MKNIIILVCCLTLVSCAEGLGSGESDKFKVFRLSGILDFVTLSSAILGPKCLRCHSWASNEDEILKRVIPGDPENSILYQLVENGSMPAGGPELTDEEKRAIYDYILNIGLDPEPEPDPIPIPDSTEEKFAKLRQTIFAPKCLKCHAWVGDLDGIEEHLVPGEPENSPLFIFTNNGAMPLGAPDLSDDEVAEIEDFILTFERMPKEETVENEV